MIVIDKPEGMTPLQALHTLRVQYPQYAKATLSYAGRLDPMASGLLPVLVDGENKQRERYLGLDKEYEFEVLFGVSTDTHDVLGLIDRCEPQKVGAVSQIEGRITQEYPAYSSKTVQGKALHVYARSEALNEIEIPTRQVTISNMSEIGRKEMTGEEMLSETVKRVGRVEGDFRQKEIIERWKLRVRNTSTFTIVRFRASVSSGTYIRSLAVELGKQLGIPALAYSIRRTRVGALTLTDALSIAPIREPFVKREGSCRSSMGEWGG